MAVNYEIRYAVHPEDARSYDTARLRKEFLAGEIMQEDRISLVYSFYDRFIVGGAVPVKEELLLDTIDPLKADYFLQRRELGVINVGAEGEVVADRITYELGYKDALYVGRGVKEVIFRSKDPQHPARYYLNSANAHTSYPVKRVTLADAEVVNLGAPEQSNERQINKLLVHGVVDTCQLQMGMTELKPGSVWNTMPAHVHSRRMETYFYFEVPGDQAVCHFMGEPGETRHIWLGNEQAVISPPWSIHAAAGTSNYIFIWGMAGENLDYGDMDFYGPTDLK